jgi:hypothetical protein
LSRRLSDHIYQQAALGLKDTAGLLFLQLGAGSAVGVSTGIFARLLYQPKTRPGRKTSILLAAVLALTVGAFLTLIGAVDNADTCLNLKFRQRLTILAPHLQPNEEKELAAMWAAMRNRADYDAVNQHLQRYETRAGLGLPKPCS